MKPFRVEFTDNKLTGNAGLVHLGRFAKKLRLQNILERHISISRGENAKYDVPTAIIMLMLGALSGVKHLSHMLLLKTDTVIRQLCGWDSFAPQLHLWTPVQVIPAGPLPRIIRGGKRSPAQSPVKTMVRHRPV